MNNENDFYHIFGNTKHKLDNLVKLFGGERELLRVALDELNGKVPFDRAFEDVVILIRGQPVYLRGKIVNEIPRISTMFIK